MTSISVVGVQNCLCKEDPVVKFNCWMLHNWCHTKPHIFKLKSKHHTHAFVIIKTFHSTSVFLESFQMCQFQYAQFLSFVRNTLQVWNQDVISKCGIMTVLLLLLQNNFLPRNFTQKQSGYLDVQKWYCIYYTNI